MHFEPYAEAHPEMAVKGLVPTTFPAGDHAANRRRRIKAQTILSLSYPVNLNVSISD